MKKNRINLKNVATIVACFAVCMMLAFTGCKKDEKKDDNGGGGGGGGTEKLSPPSWLLGKWETSVNQYYEFTSNNVVVSGKNIDQMPGIASVSEFKKTTDTYVLLCKGTLQNMTYYYSFKKGDGSYIEVGTGVNEEPTDFLTFNKVNGGGGGGEGTGSGKLEAGGKPTTLFTKAEWAAWDTKNEHRELEFRNDNYEQWVSISFLSWSSKDIPVGNFTLTTTPKIKVFIALIYDDGYGTKDNEMEIKKSGSNYEVTLTGKWAYDDQGEDWKDYKFTYKGPIKILEN